MRQHICTHFHFLGFLFLPIFGIFSWIVFQISQQAEDALTTCWRFLLGATSVDDVFCCLITPLHWSMANLKMLSMAHSTRQTIVTVGGDGDDDCDRWW